MSCFNICGIGIGFGGAKGRSQQDHNVGDVFKPGAIIPYEHFNQQHQQDGGDDDDHHDHVEQQRRRSSPCHHHQSITSSSRRRRNQIPWVYSKSFHENYEIVGELGRGSFSIVYDAQRKNLNPLEDPSTSSITDTKTGADANANTDVETTAGTTTSSSSYLSNSNSNFYAVKVVDRNKLYPKKALQDFIQEVTILSELNHTNIIQLVEIYKQHNPSYFFVVMEKLHGGELYDELCLLQYYNECDCRDIVRPIFNAIAYCHSKKVVHRDLKPENLLLKERSTSIIAAAGGGGGATTDGDGGGAVSTTTTVDENRRIGRGGVEGNIKVADFGFSKRCLQEESLITRCGTPVYMAPEIIRYRNYDERVDNWSLGVILYTLLGGYLPFNEPTKKELFQQILQGNYQFHSEYWDGISYDAKHLIQSLLQQDFKTKRITSQQVLNHPWMTGRTNGGDDDDLLLRQKSSSSSLTNNLEQFKIFNKERKKQNEQQQHNNDSTNSVSMYWLLTRK